jgi:hypothetical protein
MPYQKIFGQQVYYRTTGSFSGGFAIFWYIFFGGLTLLFLVFGLQSYFSGNETHGLENNLVAVAFFGLFWLIPFDDASSVDASSNDTSTDNVEARLERLEQEQQELSRQIEELRQQKDQ